MIITTSRWYQDLDVCKQVDNRDKPYDTELLHSMYDYLCAHGDCYYIEYNGVLIGDVSMRDSGEIAIVICKHRLTRAHREKQLKMSCQALHNAPPNRT